MHRKSVQSSATLGSGTDKAILGPRRGRKCLVLSNTGAHVVVFSFGQGTASGVTGVTVTTTQGTITLRYEDVGDCLELDVTANSGGGTGSCSWIEAWES